jgi:hypothetical protein
MDARRRREGATMDETPYASLDPIRIDTHDDLLREMARISERMNAHPEIARLVLVNPVLAFEDIGVRLSPVMQRHIVHTLRFPKRLLARKARLESELVAELAELGISEPLPLTPDVRRDLLCRLLAPVPAEGAQADDATGNEAAAAPPETGRLDLRAYARKHPLLAKLVEYDRVRQGGLVFYPREVYRAYKEGRKQHRWLTSFRFKV